jgi:ABC-type bacteriocin/lantibiotic exporter with double-glycine peptidase domain
MALDYLEQHVDYNALLKLLEVEPHGAWFQNLRLLEKIGVKVLVEKGEIESLRQSIEDGLPPIALVNTGELPYWTHGTSHAVVVVGFDGDWVYLNDPEFPDAPKIVSAAGFELAWIDFDQFFALIRLQ